jgi:DNA-binding CsgD family transcriptional regulator
MVRNVAAQAGPQEPAFLIFILDPERPMRVDEDWLRQLYGLTPCEARLANLLIEGKTFDNCCNQLEIRPSTARMHLGNLFAKTGVQRQGQLISLLMRSLGMIRSPESVVRATKEETSNEITNRFPRLRYGFT